MLHNLRFMHADDICIDVYMHACQSLTRGNAVQLRSVLVVSGSDAGNMSAV